SRAIEACVNGLFRAARAHPGYGRSDSPCTRPRFPCSAPAVMPVRALLFSADLLISQAFLEIFAFCPPFTGIYRDGGKVAEHREPGSGHPSISSPLIWNERARARIATPGSSPGQALSPRES